MEYIRGRLEVPGSLGEAVARQRRLHMHTVGASFAPGLGICQFWICPYQMVRAEGPSATMVQSMARSGSNQAQADAARPVGTYQYVSNHSFR
jgi:hypothetical protein